MRWHLITYNIIIGKLTNNVTILPHGTTIETLIKNGHQMHRVCCLNEAMCRYTSSFDEAQSYADIFEQSRT